VDGPFYLPLTDEVAVFEAAVAARLPVLLKGPTGCGKTRFVEHMAWKLNRNLTTVACYEDLTATDLVGRYLLSGEETLWMDGPLTRAVRQGSFCYLDEVVEARKDTTVIIHSLTDHRRVLTIDKTAETVQAHDDFLLVISYNPGYQSVLKDLKPSTRQRFVSIEFTYPSIGAEAQILVAETGVVNETAERLARCGAKTRGLHERGLEEGVSTRLLVYAAHLIVQGLEPRRACQAALVQAISDDVDMQQAVGDIVDVIFP